MALKPMGEMYRHKSNSVRTCTLEVAVNLILMLPQSFHNGPSEADFLELSGNWVAATTQARTTAPPRLCGRAQRRRACRPHSRVPRRVGRRVYKQFGRVTNLVTNPPQVANLPHSQSAFVLSAPRHRSLLVKMSRMELRVSFTCLLFPRLAQKASAFICAQRSGLACLPSARLTQMCLSS
jgi:hypothetical protein